jgi:hypothetical protein
VTGRVGWRGGLEADRELCDGAIDEGEERDKVLMQYTQSRLVRSWSRSRCLAFVEGSSDSRTCLKSESEGVQGWKTGSDIAISP